MGVGMTPQSRPYVERAFTVGCGGFFFFGLLSIIYTVGSLIHAAVT